MKPKPKIVVLDGHTLNPGDLSWEPLAALGECIVHDRTTPELTVPRALGAPIVLTNKTVLNKAVLDRLPGLEYIGVLATGHNVVDVSHAAHLGVVVSNVPAYSTMSVAQTVFAHIMEHAHNVGLHSASVRGGEWSASPDFAYWLRPLVELDGLALGIVGYGRIGRQVAAIGRAFGMRALIWNRTPPGPLPAGMEYADLDRLFREADVLSLHCALAPETAGLVNAARLATMKRSAIVINTSRGPVVDEAALAGALEAGIIAGAGLDVLESEPPAPGNPLLKARNVTFTPHVGWATGAARARLMRTATDNVRAFLAGCPQNVVTT
jgi:glycerate dehydrogenase